MNEIAKKENLKLETLELDVDKEESVKNAINKIVKEKGRIDILVNNAGINMKKEFTEVTDAEFQSVITTNVCSVFAMSREVVKHMLPKKSGVIINIIMFIMTWKGVFDKRGHYLMIEKAGLYWHFVDLVWVFVFTCFYLF